MMTPEERARLERLESLIGILFGTVSSQALAGDITGTTLASVLTRIQALAGGGNRLVVVDNAGNVLASTPVLAMGGDVTGTTAASVISVIAALAGSGTVLVAVDNAGNVISGGAPFSLPYTVTTMFTGIVPGTGPGSSTFDIDLSTAAFTDSVVYLKAEVYATTKENGGIPTPNLVSACVILSEAVYDNKNGAVSLATAAAGGAANPMPAQNNEMTLFPQVCDTNLQSGGGAAMNAVWSVSGGTLARLTVTNGNAANDADVEIDITMRRKMA